jgi:S1-C subfamily serine protease
LVHRPLRRRACVAVVSLAAAALPAFADDGAASTIARVKASVVAVGTYERLRSPQFRFAGTGFAVDDGLKIATNEHVLPKTLNAERNETLAIAIRGPASQVEIRAARRLAADASHDLALIQLEGKPLPALRLGNSERVREGETFLFTGFPIGAMLGLYPVTHRSMIAAVAPIAIPAAGSDKLDARAARRLLDGAYPVFQLDASAYPGNSGSPVYDDASGEVIGIVNSVLVKSTRESALAQPTGITYAIPVRKLSELLERSRAR